jgi:uracil-DNA glycosylase
MILFVGDRPSKRTDPNVPFKGASCEKRLMEWIAKININPYYIVNSVDKEALNTAFMFHQCRAPIVALGNNASKSLGGLPHFKLPHPSGRNRQINDKEFIDKKIKECKIYLKYFNK